MYVIKLKTLIIYAVILTVAAFSVYCFYSDKTVAVTNDEQPRNGEEITLPVIMYHGITENAGKVSKYVISSEMFEQDLKSIQKSGFETILIDDLINYVYNNGNLPEKPILLTFDDGYYNNYSYAYPILKKYNMKAVISIIGKWTDDYSENEIKNPNYSHLTWDNIREMQQSGLIEVENHTYDMHTNESGRNGTKKKRGENIEAYTKTLNSDIGKLQSRFYEETGTKPTTFAYPFGSVSNDSFQILKDMGFKVTLSCEEKMNTITRNPDCLYMLNRYLRSNKVSVEKILSNLSR